MPLNPIPEILLAKNKNLTGSFGMAGESGSDVSTLTIYLSTDTASGHYDINRSESMKQRWRGCRFILFYKGLKDQASIPVEDLKTPLRHTRIQNSFQLPYARTDAFKHSFFAETIRDSNALPASTVSSVECSEDCISRFTSMMSHFIC